MDFQAAAAFSPAAFAFVGGDNVALTPRPPGPLNRGPFRAGQ
jgi:hypothetical protein